MESTNSNNSHGISLVVTKTTDESFNNNHHITTMETSVNILLNGRETPKKVKVLTIIGIIIVIGLIIGSIFGVIDKDIAKSAIEAISSMI